MWRSYFILLMIRETFDFPKVNSTFILLALALWRSTHSAIFPDLALVAGRPPGTISLLNKNACRNNLARRVTDFQGFSRCRIDQLDLNIPRRSGRCRIR